MKKLIMDVDTGIDDALAIAYAITLEDYELIGITAAFGNVDQISSQKNALTILDNLKRSDVKVYPGLMGIEGEGDYVSESLHVHGANGLGGVNFTPSKREAEKTSAIEFLASSIERYGSELVIYTSGPLANIAELYRQRPDLVKKTGKIVSMGGALFVSGNCSPIAEANIYHDAKDANFLLSLGLDIT
ncbi:MAG: nucleoside hydrolase, partial [Sphaerochaetaceae bacterium]|nr:nucleoside hydrolase [Sphaerochaetaceae bacterium]